MANEKKLIILGIRGLPAQHGGFETFAEKLGIYLQQAGWEITVYCQEEGSEAMYESIWEGVRRIHIHVANTGALGTIVFDWKAVVHSLSQPGIILTLGYNTAIFNVLYRIRSRLNIINMDGIEWRREKWKLYEKAWLYINERLACWIGNYLIADHPEIEKHLQTRVSNDKIVMIPYGANNVEQADSSVLKQYNLIAKKYCIVVARPEPENSILEIVRGFSSKRRGCYLVVLGAYDKENDYHNAVLASASDEVIFLGAIYDSRIVEALRLNALLYIHGHTVGGTNPSLIEALGAGSAVLAHDNKFNRWVIGEGSFFSSENEFDRVIGNLLCDNEKIKKLESLSRERYISNFTWDEILNRYEDFLLYVNNSR